MHNYAKVCLSSRALNSLPSPAVITAAQQALRDPSAHHVLCCCLPALKTLRGTSQLSALTQLLSQSSCIAGLVAPELREMMRATQTFLHEEGCINFGVLLDSEPGELHAMHLQCQYRAIDPHTLCPPITARSTSIRHSTICAHLPQQNLVSS